MVSVLQQYSPSQDRHSERSQPRQQRQTELAEVLVFLFLIVPSLALSLLVRRQPTQLGFSLTAVAIILRDLSLAALIFYFLWRNGESIRRIGWSFKRMGREVLIGALLFPPFFLLTLGMDYLFLKVGLSQERPGAAAFLQPHGTVQLVLAGVLVAVVAVTEETIFRGYLLLRLSAVSRSVVFAVILSSFIFSIGHGYEGMAGVATVGVMGLIFALIYVWRSSLVAPITMHFLQDFLVIVVFTAAASQSTPASPDDASHSAAVLNPAMPAESRQAILPDLDEVLVMTVNSGFSKSSDPRFAGSDETARSKSDRRANTTASPPIRAARRAGSRRRRDKAKTSSPPSLTVRSSSERQPEHSQLLAPQSMPGRASYACNRKRAGICQPPYP
jgi:membrane protease YdiL (CAAX protease family)